MEASILEHLPWSVFLAAARIIGFSVLSGMFLFVVFYIFGRTRFQNLRLPHASTPSRWLKQAVLSQLNLLLLIIPVTAGILWGPNIKQNSLSPWIDTTGWPYAIGIVLFVLLWVDAEFFWVHYFFHRFGSSAHAVHHQFRNPSPFAGWAFHWIEGAAYAVAYFPVMVLLPLPPISALALTLITNFWNAYLHLGYEPLPKSVRSHWFGQWFHTARTHCGHHQDPRYVYALYFTFWDRWMGTDLPK